MTKIGKNQSQVEKLFAEWNEHLCLKYPFLLILCKILIFWDIEFFFHYLVAIIINIRSLWWVYSISEFHFLKEAKKILNFSWYCSFLRCSMIHTRNLVLFCFFFSIFQWYRKKILLCLYICHVQSENERQDHPCQYSKWYQICHINQNSLDFFFIIYSQFHLSIMMLFLMGIDSFAFVCRTAHKIENLTIFAQ